MSERPRVTSENFDAVYDYYAINRRNRGFSETIHHAAHHILRPDVELDDNVRDSIQQAITEQKGIIVTANHPSQHDAFTMPAAMTETGIPELMDIAAAAKSELFQNPFTRFLFEHTGCIPVFRQKSDAVLNREHTLARANRLNAVLVERLQRGENIAILPEGERSSEDDYEYVPLNKIKTGVARLAIATSGQSVILPLGIYYDTPNPKQTLPKRHAAVTFGPVITDYSSSIQGVRRQVHESINAALAESVARKR